jgi:hypothetical protein
MSSYNPPSYTSYTLREYRGYKLEKLEKLEELDNKSELGPYYVKVSTLSEIPEEKLTTLPQHNRSFYSCLWMGRS